MFMLARVHVFSVILLSLCDFLSQPNPPHPLSEIALNHLAYSHACFHWYFLNSNEVVNLLLEIGKNGILIKNAV